MALYGLRYIVHAVRFVYNTIIRSEDHQTTESNHTSVIERIDTALYYVRCIVDELYGLDGDELEGDDLDSDDDRTMQRTESHTSGLCSRWGTAMALYQLKQQNHRGRPIVRTGSSCRILVPRDRLRRQRHEQKDQLEAIRERVEEKICILENMEAWAITVERIFCNDPEALAMARQNNPIGVRDQLDAIAEQAERLREGVKKLRGSKYHYSDSYGMSAPPVYRARLFMSMLEEAYNDKYRVEKAALEKAEMLKRRKDSLFDEECSKLGIMDLL